MFPIKDGISWEGHLSGFTAGLILAVVLKAKIPQVKKFEWEKEDYKEEEDDFLQHFDEDGNFIENKQEDAGREQQPLKISYHYKKEHKSDK